jgi:hypothetical protein
MPTVRACVMSGLIAMCLGLILGSARAASPEPGDPTYRALRYNDDFSWLADPAKSSDPLDPLKYVPLGDSQYGPSYFSFGGELRERFESYFNPNFGINAPRSSGYLMHRLQLHSDLHVTDYFRAFLQLSNTARLGNRGVQSTTDINDLEVSQAFVDVRLPSPLGDAPVFRVGREELLFGFQRLIAVREGPNVRRVFDGFRFTDHWGDVTIDLFHVRPLNNSVGAIDDRTNQKQLLWGGYLTVPLGPVLKADVYWLNYENEAARFRGLTGVELRQTYGLRLFGAAEGFDWNGEAAIQTGSFRGRQIRASMFAGIAGYTFRGVPWEPRIGLEANAASGDDGGSAIGTFNAMFPRLPYFAETSLLVPANIIDVRPVFSVKPVPDVMATFGADFLWRASTHDGLYGSGLVQYANTNRAAGGKRVGTELSADVRWRIDQHLQLGFIAAEFLAGPALKAAAGKDVTFLVAFATYRF